MYADLTATSTAALDLDDTEGVLVEAHYASDDEFISDDSFPQPGFEDDDEAEDEYHSKFDSDDDDDDMNVGKVGLHDVNTLTHLYRFGLLNTAHSKTDLEVTDI
jgi:hypothetical protein